MNNKEGKIRSFVDLQAWKEGHRLVLMVYKTTKTFPKEELFCLTSQIRRAVVSVTSNISEGFSRQSYKEKAQFYSLSLGSLTEMQNQILIAKDVNYLDNIEFNKIAQQSVTVHKLINGMIKYLKTNFK